MGVFIGLDGNLKQLSAPLEPFSMKGRMKVIPTRGTHSHRVSPEA